MFIKYPSIENSYKEKYLDFFRNLFPDLDNCNFTIESKIDGSNISVITKPNGEITYASRNQMISSNFMGLNTATEKYSRELGRMSDYSQRNKVVIHWYCELFGKGIMNRINYGEEKYLKIFAIRIDKEFKSPRFLYDLVKELGIENMLIPVLGVAHGLTEALNWKDDYITLINPESGDFEEGIVIKPLNSVYISPVGEIFQLKKKNEKFAEIKSKGSSKQEQIISDEVLDAKKDFERYITESRLYGIFSKDGMIKESREIGYFIKKMMIDAKKDWVKDNSDLNFTSDEEKVIFNVGNKISKMLLDVLSKEN